MNLISKLLCLNKEILLLDEDFNDEQVIEKNNKIANTNLKTLFDRSTAICDDYSSFAIYSERLLANSSKEQQVLENLSNDLTFATNISLIQYYVKFFGKYYVNLEDRNDIEERCKMLDVLNFLHTYARCTTVRYLYRVEGLDSVYDTYQQKFEYCGQLKNPNLIDFAESYLKELKDIIIDVDMCNSSAMIKIDDIDVHHLVNQSIDIFGFNKK